MFLSGLFATLRRSARSGSAFFSTSDLQFKYKYNYNYKNIVDPAREAMLQIDNLILRGKTHEALRYASSLREAFPDHPYPLFCIATTLTDQGLSLNAFGLDANVCAIVEDFNKNFAGKPGIPAVIKNFFNNLSLMLQQNPDPQRGIDESQIYSPISSGCATPSSMSK